MNNNGWDNNGGQNNGNNQDSYDKDQSYNNSNGNENYYYGSDNNSENNYYYGSANNGQWGNGQKNQNDYAFRTVMNNGRPKTLGWSVASMVLGIISVVCCCLGYSSIFLGIGAIVLSIVARKSLGYFDGLSIAGLVLGIFGVVFGIAILAAISAVGEEFWDEYLEEFKKAYEEAYPDF